MSVGAICAIVNTQLDSVHLVDFICHNFQPVPHSLCLSVLLRKFQVEILAVELELVPYGRRASGEQVGRTAENLSNRAGQKYRGRFELLGAHLPSCDRWLPNVPASWSQNKG